MRIELKKTNRGFEYCSFKDLYNESCSLQKSSICLKNDEEAIWFGTDSDEVKILASHAIKLGMDTKGETTGWVTYPFPKDAEISINNRMHLTQSQVKELLPILQNFVKTGDIELVPVEEETCKWVKTGDMSFKASCKEKGSFYIENPLLVGNQYSYCPLCSKPIEVVEVD